MQKVLLILFSYAGMDKIIARLTQLIEKDDSLYVVGVVLQEISPSFSTLISDIGFLGDKVVRDVQKAVGDIYQENARIHLNEIEDEFKKQDINVIKDEITDADLVRIDRKVKEEEVDKIIINYTKNEYIIHSAIDTKVQDFFNRNDIPVEIYYDGIK